jgi:soluble lytic murein transglycosylase
MQFSAILTSLLISFALTAGLMLPQAVAAKGGSAATTTGDELILEMSQAYKRGDRKRLTALLPKVQGHALEPWAAYWELAVRLGDAGPSEIRSFLARYANTYQEDRLRNDWLLALGKRRDWATFNAEHPKYRMNDDKAVRCYALLNEFNQSGADVAPMVEELWLSQKEAEDGCATAADQQIKAGKLKAHTAWLRARLGFENDRPGIATQAVAMINPDWVSQVNAIYARPSQFLDDKMTALRPRTKELVTLALVRLATTDVVAAANELNKIRWKTQLTQEERSWVWGVIGKRAARRLSDGATTYFSNAQDTHLDGDHLSWKVRAALRAGAWSQVQSAITAMKPSQRQDPTWVYWLARSIAAQKSPDAAAQSTALLESIASPRSFYEQLAQEDLGRLITAPVRPEPLIAAEKEAALQNPGLVRGLYAIRIGLRADGVREWNYTIGLHQRGGMPDRELLAAAQMACDQQVWDRCINTSDRTKTLFDFEQRFPMPHQKEVVQRASKIGLDPAFVYGLIRQESRFIMDAQSHVGASGLMQVMPATARWTARKIGMTDFQAHQINDRDTNIAIGTGYLKMVLDNFDGSMPLAAAAYNAGPSRSRNWRGMEGDPVLEAAIWAENIPFTETRDYVKKVLSNTTNYAAVITGKPQSLKARLGTVGPARAGKAQTDEELP